MVNEPYIVASGLVKIFKVAGIEVVALQGLDLEVSRGEILALVGPSGSGKSTLLSALGGLDRPSAGRLIVDGQDLLTMNQGQLTTYRRTKVGMVWQQTTRNLLPYLSARANVELLMTLGGSTANERREWIDELLDAVGMREYAHQTPGQLSGGQQQRIAIACALANKPQILLADEPTGEVDWTTAQRILQLLRELRARYNITIVMVTHDPRVAEQADRVIAIRDGRTSTETIRALDGGQVVSTLTNDPGSRRSSEELVVLDSAGRLQLPSEQRVLAGISRRARVELVDGGILVRPSNDGDTQIAGESSGNMTYHSLYTIDEEPLVQAAHNRFTDWWQSWRSGRKH